MEGRLAMIRSRRPGPGLAVPALLIAVGVGGFARTGRADIFADIPGIPGESVSVLAPGQIDVRSIQFGSGRAASAIAKQKGSAACGAKAGPQIGQLVITKGTDKASPKLFMAAAAGTRFPTVTITFFKDDPSGPTQYLKIKLTDALVDSISSAGASSDTPTENVSLSFASMETTYSKIGNPDETATAAFCLQ
jgi:type VI secretion system secreted protein Hcp